MTLDIITSTCTGDWLSQEISSRNCHFAEKQQQPDRMARTVWTGLSGQDNWERTARNGYPGQDQQDRTARTGLPGKDSQKRRQIARTGEPRQDCKERIARKDSQNWTTRTGRPWLTDKLGQYLDIDIRLQGFFASRQFVKKSPFLNLDCWRRFFKSIFLARYIKKKNPYTAHPDKHSCRLKQCFPP